MALAPAVAPWPIQEELREGVVADGPIDPGDGEVQDAAAGGRGRVHRERRGRGERRAGPRRVEAMRADAGRGVGPQDEVGAGVPVVVGDAPVREDVRAAGAIPREIDGLVRREAGHVHPDHRAGRGHGMRGCQRDPGLIGPRDGEEDASRRAVGADGAHLVRPQRGGGAGGGDPRVDVYVTVRARAARQVGPIPVQRDRPIGEVGADDDEGGVGHALTRREGERRVVRRGRGRRRRVRRVRRLRRRGRRRGRGGRRGAGAPPAHPQGEQDDGRQGGD